MRMWNVILSHLHSTSWTDVLNSYNDSIWCMQAVENGTINIKIDSNRSGNKCFYGFYDFIIYR